jgi:hypothetical protein
MALTKVNTETNPSYRDVVEPMLREGEGDASELLRTYPNFDADTVPEDTGGYCYLLWACHCYHFHTVRGLLQCGANLLRKGEGGCTALHQACCWSAKDEKAVLVAWLLSEHADARATINWANKCGSTALHFAAGRGSSAVMRVLLAHGADPTCEDFYGKTPAQIARNLGELSTAKLLEAAERTHMTLLEVGEWRPRLAPCFPRKYRATMRTLVLLAKAIQ